MQKIKLYKFFEATLDYFIQGATSNLTQKRLDDRYQNEFEIVLNSATYYRFSNFLETIFFAKSTYGATDFIAAASVPQAPNGYYILVLRFYKVKKYLENIEKNDYLLLEEKIKTAVHSTDVKFYSDCSDFFYQGVWEDLAKENSTIFKFPGPKGSGYWHQIHNSTGGLKNPNIHLTKHLTQLVREFDSYIPEIAKKLKIK